MIDPVAEEEVGLVLLGPKQNLATDSKTLSISGAHRVNGRFQKSYFLFLINSIKVTNNPH